MIDAIDEALQALQASLFAAEVYFPEHPAARTQLQCAGEILRRLLADRAEVTVSAFEDRIVFDGTPLPSSPGLITGLFQRLRQRGKEFITFLPGVTDEELGQLLEHLRRPAESELAFEDKHLRTGAVTMDDGPSGEMVTSGTRLRQHAEILGDTWAALEREGRFDTKSLFAVVSDICTSVVMSQGELLPLASLKRHDEYSFIHSVNVAILSAALAEAVCLPPDWLLDLTVAALLHDVGKQIIPGEILRKEGMLTDEEMRIIELHPTAGAALLMRSDDIPPLASVVAFEHHMRPDGTGYPKVPGRGLHLASRIVQVADVFDALRTHRPYRSALPFPKASDILRQQVGPHSPRLVDVFLDQVAILTDREHVRDDLDHQMAA